MKLASLKDGSRDGRLVVVSRDLTRCTDASFLAPTLQAAIDDWRRISPHLAALGESLEVGSVPSIRFHEHDAHAPLPRAYQHSGCTDAFCGPRDPIVSPTEAYRRRGAVALIADDLQDSDAADAVILIMLALVPDGDHGVSAFSPVAVTKDEIGATFDSTQPLRISVNGKVLESGARAASLEDLATALAGAGRARPIESGAVVVASSTADAVTLQEGDTVRLEMRDRAGHTIFGAIEQTVASVRAT